MGHGDLIANLDRAGDHAALLGVGVLLAVVGWLLRRAISRTAARTCPERARPGRDPSDPD
jgi:hypothetical protein